MAQNVSQNQYEVRKTDEEWRDLLSTETYRVLRKSGTERAFTGKYHDHKGDGVYVCAGCGNPLFDSHAKFDSGSGWPSYYEPVSADRIEERSDRSLFMARTEVLCAKCGGHLGHVFSDGPEPTGMRYCMNSASLQFQERKTEG